MKRRGSLSLIFLYVLIGFSIVLLGFTIYLNSGSVTGGVIGASEISGVTGFGIIDFFNSLFGTQEESVSLAPVPGVVAEYAFDEGTGTVAGDSSGNLIDGTVFGSAVWTTGQYSGALTFDGVDDYVETGTSALLDIFGTQGFTYSAWVKVNALPSAGVVSSIMTMTETGQSSADWDKSIDILSDGRVRLWVFDGATVQSATSTTALVPGTFYYLAGTYDGATLTVYVDGVLEGTGTSTSSFDFVSPQLVFSYDTTSSTDVLFNGVIDNARIYNRALSLAEIGQDMADPVGGAPSCSVDADCDDGLFCNGVETCVAGACQAGTPVSCPAGQTCNEATDLCEGDTTPPLISSVASTGITDVSSTITWTTDEVSDSLVRYGTTLGGPYPLTTTLDPTLVTSHSVGLTGLTPSTTYFYVVESTDPSLNTATSAENSFVTLAAPPPPGTPPVAEYAFDEGTGTVVGDSSGNLIDGTVFGSAVWTTTGKYRNALIFDGVDDYVETGTSTSLGISGTQPFTYSAWVKVNALPLVGTVSSIMTMTETGQSSADWGKSLDIQSDGTVKFWVFDGAAVQSAVSTTALVPGTFYYLTGVYDGATLSVYIDGVLEGTGTSTSTFGFSTPQLVFSYDTASAGDVLFNGVIDEARVYNRALSLAEIQTDMAAPVGGALCSVNADCDDGLFCNGAETCDTIAGACVTGTPPCTQSQICDEAGDVCNADLTAPVILSGPNSVGVGDLFATITWTTDENSDSQVNYGTSPGVYTLGSGDLTLVTSHSIGLTGLSPSTTYYYQVESKDFAGNLVQSVENTFTTGALGVLQACADGKINSECICEDRAYADGYCCRTSQGSDVYFDPGYSGCPAPTDYLFVDQNNPAASDLNPGTELLPWKDLEKATDSVVAGQVVLVKEGEFLDSNAPSKTNVFGVMASGTPTSPIVIKSWPKHAALLLQQGIGGNAAFVSGGRTYLVIDGFKVDGGLGCTGCSNIVIKNLDLKGGVIFGNDPTLNWGIFLDESGNSNTIENNFVHDMRRSWNFKANNGLIEVFNQQNAIIQNNVADGSNDAVQTLISEKGGGQFNNLYRYNLAIGAGETSNCFTGMSWNANTDFSTDNTYYGNIAYNCMYSDAILIDHKIQRYKIYNNIFYNVYSAFNSNSNSATTNSANEAWNNILIGLGPGATIMKGAEAYNVLFSYMDYNLIKGFDFFGKVFSNPNSPNSYRTLSSWQAATGFDLNSLIDVDPQFVNVPVTDIETNIIDPLTGELLADFHLQPTSPALGAGIDRQDFDNDGNTLENINMGAYITGNEVVGLKNYDVSKSCSNLLGTSCSAGDSCSGKWLNANDVNYCCSATCNACSFTGGTWDVSTAEAGSQVSLQLTTSQCDNLKNSTVEFVVVENDLFSGNDFPVNQPDNSKISSFDPNVVQTWIAEWQKDALFGDPEYSFTARLAENNAISITSPLLKVTDINPPVILSSIPSTNLPLGAEAVTLSVVTDETATCGYSTISGVDFSIMTPFAVTGTTTHEQTITGLTDLSVNNYYVRCEDLKGNANAVDYVISFSVTGLPNLVAGYNFDEGAGTTVRDYSGNGIDGTVTGSRWVAGKYGNALQFENFDDYVETVGSSLLNIGGVQPYTFNTWVKTDVFPPMGRFAELMTIAENGQTTSSDKILSVLSDGAAQISSFSGGGGGFLDVATSTEKMKAGEFYYLSGVYDGANYFIYINGELVGTGTAPFTGSFSAIPGPGLVFAYHDPSSGFGFNWMGANPVKGVIDEPSVYSRALSQDEIKTLMNTQIKPVVAQNPTVNIFSPTKNSVVVSNTFNVSFSTINWAVEGKGNNHVHFQIDGGPDNLMFYNSPDNVVELNTVAGPTSSATWIDSNTIQLNNLLDGPHTIRAQLVDSLHNPLVNAEADKTLNIVVDTSIKDGLVLAYNYDEGSGTLVNDFSANNIDTNLLSGAGWDPLGKNSIAVSYDGINDYSESVTSGFMDFGDKDPYTYSAWIKVDNYPPLNSHANILMMTEDGNTPTDWDRSLILTDEGKIRFAAFDYSSVKVAESQTPLSLGTWHYVAGVRDHGGNLFLYVDGVLERVGYTSFSWNFATPQLVSSFIDNSGLSVNFDGSLDDLRIYDRGLSQTEIIDDMNTPVGAAASPPDTTPPLISSVASTSITDVSSTITWTTDEVSDSLVRYGTTLGGPYPLTTTLDPTFVTSHSVGLTGLTPSTTYFYVVESTDPSLNTATSTESSFVTTAFSGCLTNADCDDGIFCNGVETCVAGTCVQGTPPQDDGVTCTVDVCDELTATVTNTPDNTLCDNGLFCDGTETCDPLLDCQIGTPVSCPAGQTCNEATSSCVAAPADECLNWQIDHPEWIWCDNFDTVQDLTVNYQDFELTNGLAATQEDPFSGLYSVRQQYSVGQIDAGYLSWFYSDALGQDNSVYGGNHGNSYNEIYVRWYHKFQPGFQSNPLGSGAEFPVKMFRIADLEPDWSRRTSVQYWIDDYVIFADVQAPDSSQANALGWLPPISSTFSYNDPANVGRWICHEMYVKTNTPGLADGIYRFWADDNLIIEKTGVDLIGNTANSLNFVMLENYYNSPGSPAVQNRYFDNLVFSTQKIGCGALPPPPSTCGNSIVETGEQCDDGNLIETDTCSNACMLTVCGDNIIQSPNGQSVLEICDGNSQACTDAQGYAGTQACNALCLGFDACVSTESCGDGIINGNELCDDGVLNGQPGQCSLTCDGFVPLPCSLTSATWSTSSTVEGSLVTLTVNGNNCDAESLSFVVTENDGILPGDLAFVQPANAVFSAGTATTTWTAEWRTDQLGNPEYYFDASLVSDSSNTIRSSLPDLTVTELSPTCGNGILQTGEQCDNGASNSDTLPDACRTTCVLPSCGDTVVDTGEVCELGNTQACTDASGYSGTQACNALCLGFDACITTESCGDGIINGNELCDDGVLNGQPGQCSLTCDGFVPALVPSISISSPLQGSTVSTTDVDLTFSLTDFIAGGKTSDHLHFYLDSDPIAFMFYNGVDNIVEYNFLPTTSATRINSNTIQFNNLSDGSHTIKAQLADSLHTELINPEAQKTITFTINISAPTQIIIDDGGYYDGTTTNFSNILDLNNFRITLEKIIYGKIEFDKNATISRSLNLLGPTNISFNNIKVDSNSIPELNLSAILILKNLTFNNPRILSDGVPCEGSSCFKISYINGTLTFNVSHFTTYSADETPFCGDGICNNGEDTTSCSVDCPAGSSTSSSGGGSGGSTTTFPPGEPENTTQEPGLPLFNESSGGICNPGECDFGNKQYCNEDGFWQESGYCDSEICGTKDSATCEQLRTSCGNNQCEKFLEENVFSCFSDCKGETVDPITIIVVILVLGFVSYFIYRTYKKKKYIKAFEDIRNKRK